MPKKVKTLNDKLTKEEELFIDAYCNNGFNALKAYQAIRPDATHSQAKGNGYHWRIALEAFIDIKRKERFEELHIDEIRVTEKLAEIAFSEKGDDYYRGMEQLKALDTLSKILGLQQNKIDATVNGQVVFLDDYKDD